MSLILEALRKSEADRRRGRAPDLLTEPLPASQRTMAPSSRPHYWPYAAGVALIAALPLAWWWWPAPDDGRATMRTQAMARTPSHDPVAPPRTAAPPPRAMPTAPATAKASPPAAATLPAGPAPARAAPAAETATQAQRSSVPPEPIAEAAPAPAVADRLPPLAPPTTDALPAFTSPELPLRLADLSSEERRQLPPLKMSMHMWGADTSQRFAIIDGNRVGEGDRVGEAMVEAIQQDGVMLAWRGRRIRLPIR